jgi:tetratricopeptide (TPR) repeat protein
MEQAIPEDQPATVPSDKSNVTPKATLLSSCLATPEWLAQMLISYKRPTAFEFDGETDTSAEIAERIANLRQLVNKHDLRLCDSEETHITDNEEHDDHHSLCPSRSQISCSTSSVCSSCASVSASATAAGSLQDKSSFCTSGTESSIVDRTPDQVLMAGALEIADLDREQAVASCIAIQTVDLNDSEDVMTEVSPIGVSFVSQFQGETPVKAPAVVEKVLEEVETEAPKTPEQVAAECHFKQALDYERSSYLDASSTSLHDALRCCISSKTPLPLLQCRIQRSRSVVEWKLGQYSSAIQTLQWCVGTLTTLLSTSEATFKTRFEMTLLLSESHRQLAVVFMSFGSSHSKQSIAQLQLSLQVCRSKMVELKKNTKAQRKQGSSQLLHSIAHSLTVLGSVYKEKGKYAKAVSLYQRGLHILVQQEAASPAAQQAPNQDQHQLMMTYRSNSALIAHTLNHMGEVFQFQYGNSHKAMDMYSEALWLYRVCLGHQHVDVAMTMLHMGQVHMEWEEFTEAKEAFGEALKVFENVLGSNHRNVATTLWYMAELQVLEQNFGQALEYFEESLEIQRQCLGDHHSDVAATYHAMAQLYEKSHQPQHAFQLYKYAWQVNKRNVGQDHWHSLAVAKDISRVQGLLQQRQNEQFFAMR